jgi:putative aldouronate transport system permease protein
MSEHSHLTRQKSANDRLNRLVDHFKREWQIYLMLLPMIIWFCVFLYKPMYGLQVAFKDYSIFRGIEGSSWIGFEHFETIFNSEQFVRALQNTFMISFLSLCFGFPVPILLALMFNEITHHVFKRTAQTIVYLPHFISTVIIAGIVITAFSPSAGVINLVLGWFGVEPIYFLIKPEWFRPIFIGSGIWQEAGFSSIVFLAAIAGVNPSLYESAVIDGASRLQMMWKITLPSILPTILIMLIIRIGNLLEVGFELIILLYRQGIQGAQYDLAAAAGLFNALVAFILVISANSISRRLTRTSLW